MPDNTFFKLQDTALLQDHAFIDGTWTRADSSKTIDVYNPATGDKIGAIPDLGAAETRRAIDAAQKAFPLWRDMLATERAAILKKWAGLINANIDDLCRILTVEQGKPLSQAKAEILNGSSHVEWMAEEGRRIYGDIIPTHDKTHRLTVIKQPVGVCVAITPWNFPSSMITRKLAPALAAGCTVVLKPSELTPFSALALAELAKRAGMPAGVLNIVTGHAKDIGAEMTSNTLVKKLSFTGSTAVGKLLMSQCASNVKKLSLELGGNAPFIVLDDADIDEAVKGAMLSKFRNSGQTCVCANRIFVQDKIYDVFAEKFIAAVKKAKVGNGLEPDMDQGPLINDKAVEKVEAHIKDATAKGGRIATGGKRHALGHTFFEPTVVTEATKEMTCFTEETFGPFAPLFRFKTDAEAIALANATEFGLAAFVYSRDVGRVTRVSEALEYGMVGVNTTSINAPQAPFGGWKESGLGSEGSKYGIEEYLNRKLIVVGGL